jgi:hypothetical protein
LDLRERIKSHVKSQHQLYPGTPPSIEDVMPQVAKLWVPEMEKLFKKYPGLATKENGD